MGGGLIVLAGPTASGKSDVALALARGLGGTVINADSMQVYRELAILTARPRLPELASVPHRLYGILPAAGGCSAARWAGLARDAIAEARAAGSLPIVVGGTGLYLAALIEGLSPVPDVPEVVRAEVRERHGALPPEALWRTLEGRDPATAAGLRPSDRQRLLRALEVLEATGRPLSRWQELPREGTYPGPVLTLLLAPPRATLYARCAARLARMLAHGVLDEVAAFVGLGLDPATPAMKILGLRPLAAHLAGRATLAAARARALTETRNFAKRQTTWFRHQLRDPVVIEAARNGARQAMAFAAAERFVELTGRH